MPTVHAAKKKRKPVKKKHATAPKRTCKVVTKKVHGKKKRVKVCTPVKAKKKKPAVRKPAAQPVGYKPTAPAFPPSTPISPGSGPSPNPPAAPGGSWTPPAAQPMSARQAERLLWRAGFGPKPGDVARFAAMGLDAAIAELVHPVGEPTLVGPAPHDDAGVALQPYDLYGHDHLWWLDRMVRSNQPLVERMALVWHDWFACSRDKVQADLMLGQNALFRRAALGSFANLLRDITVDPAMLVFLDGIDNRKGSPNENYAREVMELFTLGADRGAYTENDIRQAAKALTGWRVDYVDGIGFTNFRFDNSYHDTTVKTVFGKAGNYSWQDLCQLCLENPYHASFFVTKLWSYFVPVPPDQPTQATLQAAYVNSGYQVAPVLELIFRHPTFLDGPAMVKPPVVANAGLLRGIGRFVDTDDWAYLSGETGQTLFYPPNVAGWDDERWMDTSTWRGRWHVTGVALQPTQVPTGAPSSYSDVEDGATAVAAAIAAVGNPTLTAETATKVKAFADTALPGTMNATQKRTYRAMRQNALRLLIATSADAQTC
ncbi:hypothetical protein DSM104299_01333 [Baekduia alba]|uniref:DUF1800 domain-containing protein n=1 Tax=Baekduia alba TaxID=2997333 RepID=UPI002340011B|nr:DUF1800 domain-containing protein [Baekduia alba]WCB92636.1 hypothetical protein DSM104299_01333 [Baekduia alba]